MNRALKFKGGTVHPTACIRRLDANEIEGRQEQGKEGRPRQEPLAVEILQALSFGEVRSDGQVAYRVGGQAGAIGGRADQYVQRAKNGENNQDDVCDPRAKGAW